MYLVGVNILTQPLAYLHVLLNGTLFQVTTPSKEGVSKYHPRESLRLAVLVRSDKSLSLVGFQEIHYLIDGYIVAVHLSLI